MKRRVLFPLRECPGLVPIRELDRQVVLVPIEWTPTSRRTHPMGTDSMQWPPASTFAQTSPP